MVLTEISVKNAKAETKRREIPDSRVTGLYLIVQPSGLKSFAVRYRFGTLSRKLTLGPYPAIGLAEARRLALNALSAVAAGEDPAEEKRRKRQAIAGQNDTFEKVVDLFIERHAKANTRDWRETKRLLQKNVVPRWQDKAFAGITRQDVHLLLDSIVDRGAPVTANRTFAQLRKLCNWGVERGIIDASPCIGIRPPTIETARDRVLTLDELCLIIKAARSLGFPFGPIIELLALTGQRRNEVGGMAWSEIDIEGHVWTLSGDRTKNRRQHILPLAPAAIEVISGQPRFETSRYLFSPGANPPSGWSAAKRRLDRALAGCGAAVEPWTLHDIRRSVASGMAAVGVTLHVIERVLNHVSGSFGGIVGVYQRHSFSAEMRDALERWADAVTDRLPG